MFIALLVSRVSFVYSFLFFKQKTAYEMRISDWSSDVCSSDLAERQQHRVGHGAQHRVELLGRADQIDVQPRHRQRRRERQIVVERPEIGRQHQLRPRTRELGISARKGPALTNVEIGDEDEIGSGYV